MNRHGHKIDSVAEIEFKSALRQVASSVAVVTACLGDQRAAITATAICPLTAAPPTMLVCISERTPTGRLIRDSGVFAISFLADDQYDIARRFASAVTSAEDVSAGAWATLSTGAPVVEDSVACFDCRVENRISAGGHELYFGRVVGVTCLDRDVLIYRNRSFRRLEALG